MLASNRWQSIFKIITQLFYVVLPIAEVKRCVRIQHEVKLKVPFLTSSAEIA